MMLRAISRSFSGLVLFSVLGLAACGDDKKDDGSGTNTTNKALALEKAAAMQYALNVHANYAECLEKAKTLQAAIDAFLADPSEVTQDAAKAAWVVARKPYGESEVYRFYGGPIDNEESGPEGQINAWPLDENHIDYTRDAPTAGLINKPEFELTKEAIAQENENGGEKNIATGFHAIEFLLWGQDDADASLKTSGQRTWDDYIEGGSAQNVERRKTYLKLVTELLVEDLEGLVAAWEPEQDNYAKSFVDAEAGEAVTKMLMGMGSMAKAELSGERMTVAYKNRDQEDEHSCFSDTTNADLLGNFVGIQNVYLGRYGSDGPGIDDMVKAVDPDLDARMKKELDAAVTALEALQNTPFDFALAAEDGSEERDNVLKAIQAIKKTATTIEEIGAALGVELKLEEASEEL